MKTQVVMLMVVYAAVSYTVHAQQESVYTSEKFLDKYGERVQPPPFNFDRDISGLTLEELRYLRNEPFARKGYLFKDAVLRAWFQQYDWYQPIWWVPGWKVTLDTREEAFVARVRAREEEMLGRNFIQQGRMLKANVRNLLNTKQFATVSDTLMRALDANGFAIVPEKQLQIFDVYEENDYNLVPSFVTTDLFLQLIHMHFSFALRTLEEKKLTGALRALLNEVHGRAKALATSSESPAVRRHAEWITAWCAVPLTLLQPESPASVPATHAAAVKSEVKRATESTGLGSDFLDAPLFNYTQFRPRGHYTKNKTLQRYFRAMMWMQTAPLQLDGGDGSARVVLFAFLASAKKGPDRLAQIADPLTFLVGEDDNISMRGCVDLLRQHGAGLDAAQLIEPARLVTWTQALIATNPERIGGRAGSAEVEAVRSRPALHFFPQRYTPDAEILQRLVHVLRTPKPLRPIPKGLDIFAAFGNPVARDILLNEYREADTWPAYPDSLRAVTAAMAQKQSGSTTVYGKWLESLLALRRVPQGAQPFMQTEGWQRKSLVTALASWTELKHNTVLYAKQPFGVECGGDEPPPRPLTVGYVEPNTDFWQAALRLLDDTRVFLEKNGLMTEAIATKTKNIAEMGSFLLRVSEKELRKEKLSEQEHETIRLIGATASGITLSILDSPDWTSVTGPDRSVALATDVYTYNDVVLQEAVGYVHSIYVVVEIDGYLYLTRGGMFSYHEFTHPAAERLTDEAWQEMLEKGTAPGLPRWLAPVLAPITPPEMAPGSSYSSGC